MFTVIAFGLYPKAFLHKYGFKTKLSGLEKSKLVVGLAILVRRSPVILRNPWINQSRNPRIGLAEFLCRVVPTHIVTG